MREALYALCLAGWLCGFVYPLHLPPIDSRNLSIPLHSGNTNITVPQLSKNPDTFHWKSPTGKPQVAVHNDSNPRAFRASSVIPASSIYSELRVPETTKSQSIVEAGRPNYFDLSRLGGMNGSNRFSLATPSNSHVRPAFRLGNVTVQRVYPTAKESSYARPNQTRGSPKAGGDYKPGSQVSLHGLNTSNSSLETGPPAPDTSLGKQMNLTNTFDYFSDTHKNPKNDSTNSRGAKSEEFHTAGDGSKHEQPQPVAVNAIFRPLGHLAGTSVDAGISGSRSVPQVSTLQSQAPVETLQSAMQLWEQYHDAFAEGSLPVPALVVASSPNFNTRSKLGPKSTVFGVSPIESGSYVGDGSDIPNTQPTGQAEGSRSSVPTNEALGGVAPAFTGVYGGSPTPSTPPIGSANSDESSIPMNGASEGVAPAFTGVYGGSPTPNTQPAGQANGGGSSGPGNEESDGVAPAFTGVYSGYTTPKSQPTGQAEGGNPPVSIIEAPWGVAPAFTGVYGGSNSQESQPVFPESQAGHASDLTAESGIDSGYSGGASKGVGSGQSKSGGGGSEGNHPSVAIHDSNAGPVDTGPSGGSGTASNKGITSSPSGSDSSQSGNEGSSVSDTASGSGSGNGGFVGSVSSDSEPKNGSGGNGDAGGKDGGESGENGVTGGGVTGGGSGGWGVGGNAGDSSENMVIPAILNQHPSVEQITWTSGGVVVTFDSTVMPSPQIIVPAATFATTFSQDGILTTAQVTAPAHVIVPEAFKTVISSAGHLVTQSIPTEQTESVPQVLGNGFWEPGPSSNGDSGNGSGTSGGTSSNNYNNKNTYQNELEDPQEESSKAEISQHMGGAGTIFSVSSTTIVSTGDSGPVTKTLPVIIPLPTSHSPPAPGAQLYRLSDFTRTASSDGHLVTQTVPAVYRMHADSTGRILTDAVIPAGGTPAPDGNEAGGLEYHTLSFTTVWSSDGSLRTQVLPTVTPEFHSAPVGDYSGSSLITLVSGTGMTQVLPVLFPNSKMAQAFATTSFTAVLTASNGYLVTQVLPTLIPSSDIGNDQFIKSSFTTELTASNGARVTEVLPTLIPNPNAETGQFLTSSFTTVSTASNGDLVTQVLPTLVPNSNTIPNQSIESSFTAIVTASNGSPITQVLPTLVPNPNAEKGQFITSSFTTVLTASDGSPVTEVLPTIVPASTEADFATSWHTALTTLSGGAVSTFLEPTLYRTASMPAGSGAAGGSLVTGSFTTVITASNGALFTEVLPTVSNVSVSGGVSTGAGGIVMDGGASPTAATATMAGSNTTVSPTGSGRGKPSSAAVKRAVVGFTNADHCDDHHLWSSLWCLTANWAWMWMWTIAWVGTVVLL